METESRLMVAKGWWRGGMGSDSLKDPGPSFGKMKVFWNSVHVAVAQHCEGTKYHRIIHFKVVNFVLWDFHLNKN